MFAKLNSAEGAMKRWLKIMDLDDLNQPSICFSVLEVQWVLCVAFGPTRKGLMALKERICQKRQFWTGNGCTGKLSVSWGFF